jgi:hypothetical protein
VGAVLQEYAIPLMLRDNQRICVLLWHSNVFHTFAPAKRQYYHYHHSSQRQRSAPAVTDHHSLLKVAPCLRHLPFPLFLIHSVLLSFAHNFWLSP